LRKEGGSGKKEREDGSLHKRVRTMYNVIPLEATVFCVATRLFTAELR
jgi:hypothetical protein